MKELKIEVPQGYEVDKENSTFERIVFKKKQEIKTWEDLCNAEKKLKGFYVSDHSNIYDISRSEVREWNRGVFLTKKQAKSARAAAVISQLMPYYGGAITNEEWEDTNINKFVITRDGNKVQFFERSSWFYFLAFHTKEQRDDFYNHNKKLIKEFLMLN